MKHKLFILLGAVVFWLAQVNVSSASAIVHYEPDVPECLR
ncbi:MAG: cyclic lactone autoinducer peptide [Firmicutes bacterium]|nr:cyclic lactone autoinducer peptide [Bacillota bacterium]